MCRPFPFKILEGEARYSAVRGAFGAQRRRHGVVT
jgi:hypothetical protein